MFAYDNIDVRQIDVKREQKHSWGNFQARIDAAARLANNGSRDKAAYATTTKRRHTPKPKPNKTGKLS